MKKNWLLQLPLVLVFWFCFFISDQAHQGSLGAGLLRDRFLPWVVRAPHVFTDFKFKMRGTRPLKNKLVVVEIDSNAINALGRWPWHRDTTAYLIEKLFQSGAKVVGLDMAFSEPDPRVPAGLANLLKQKNLGSVIDTFETDKYLERVIEKYSDRLALGWLSETACHPLWDGAQNCPVNDPAALSEFPPDFDRFSVATSSLGSSFQPGLIPMLSFVTPIANIQSYQAVAKSIGFLNAQLDTDGYIRRAPLIVFAAGKPYLSLPLAMASLGLKDQVKVEIAPNHQIKSITWVNSGKPLRTNQVGEVQVNFRGPSAVVPRVSALDVMGDTDMVSSDPSQKPVSKKELLSDAYVIIGITAIGVHDMRQFPFESNSPGVDGHIHILDNILTDEFLGSGWDWHSEIFISILMVVAGAAFAWALNQFGALPGLILFLVSFISVGVLDFAVFFPMRQDLNLAYFYFEWASLFAVTIAMKYAAEERNKKFVRDAFSKYVAPAIVDSILKDPTKLTLGGEKRELTIMFSDIRGFTSFSEKMDAKALAAFLNDYLGIMTGIVFKNEGTLDKYIGDAVMAFWGAPVDQPKHAFLACQAAVEMIAALKSNQKRFKEEYGIDVEVGIGLNSGLVSVGNMGSQQNFEYTVIGDHVNLASRVEGLTKKYGVRVLTTRNTFDMIEKYRASHPQASSLPIFSYRVLDDVKVKGKKQAVELIELQGEPFVQEGLEKFNQGRRSYREQKWDEAIQYFHAANQILSQSPSSSNSAEDGPSLVFIERCEIFKSNPPPIDWDGSWEMDSK